MQCDSLTHGDDCWKGNLNITDCETVFAGTTLCSASVSVLYSKNGEKVYESISRSCVEGQQALRINPDQCHWSNNFGDHMKLILNSEDMGNAIDFVGRNNKTSYLAEQLVCSKVGYIFTSL